MEGGTGKTVLEALRDWQRLADVGKRPATIRYHRQLVEVFQRHWPDATRAATSVSRDDVTAFVLLVGHYSAPLFNAIVSVLRAVFSDAARHVKRRRVTIKCVTLPEQREFAAMLDELDRAPRGHAALVVRFLALTGIRLNEAQQLRWEHVLDDGFRLPPWLTKNGRARWVPFVGEMRGLLDRLRSVADGEHVLPQAECKRALATACRRAGITRLTHHDLRRLFATRCIESGVDVPTVAKWMGHLDGGALLGRTYFHLLDDHSRAMAARVQIAA